jgi:protein translocase SecG subunit
MSFIIGILTAILVLTCIILCLLILIQLPKKEAGMGVAFGGGATDALFGAGSGNALTKMTRYSTIMFLFLALVLSVLISRQTRTSNPAFGAGVDRAAASSAQPQPVPGTALPSAAPGTANTGSVAALQPAASNTPAQLESTNTPAPATTNNQP